MKKKTCISILSIFLISSMLVTALPKKTLSAAERENEPQQADSGVEVMADESETAKSDSSSMVQVNNEATLGKVVIGGQVWSDKSDYTFVDMPKCFIGAAYVYGKMYDERSVDILKDGYLYVTTVPRGNDYFASSVDNYGFTRLEVPSWDAVNFSKSYGTWVYEKKVRAGESVKIAGCWGILIVSETRLDVSDNGVTVSDDELAIVKSEGYSINATKVGKQIFSDRTAYKFESVPYWLAGKNYVEAPLSGGNVTVVRAGKIYMLSRASTNTNGTGFKNQGYELVMDLDFCPWSGGSFNNFGLYVKEVEVGDIITWSQWAVPIFCSEEKLPEEPEQVQMLHITEESGGELAIVEIGEKIWSSSSYVFASMPKAFIGCRFVKGDIDGSVAVEVQRSGYIYVLTKAYKTSDSQAATLDELNYTKLDLPGWKFCNFPTSSDAYIWVYEKYVQPGEKLKLSRWSVVIVSDDKLDLTDNGYTVSDEQMAVVKSASGKAALSMEIGAQVFGNRSQYTFYDMPYWLAGKNYIVTDFKASGANDSVKVTREGILYMMCNATEDQAVAFENLGFEKASVPDFEPFGGSSQNGQFPNNGYALFQKKVNVGDEISWSGWAIPIFSGELILPENIAVLKPGTGAAVSVLENNVKLFSDRSFCEKGGTPEPLLGKSFLYGSIEGAAGTVTKAGTLYIQIPVKASSYKIEEQLIADGFIQTPYRIYRNNVNLGFSQRLYQKEVSVGEKISYGKYNLLIYDILYGDVDGDGELSVKDLVHLKKYVCLNSGAVNVNFADLNKDAAVTNEDVAELRRKLVEIE